MSDGRAAILGRIREALKLSAPMPGDHGSDADLGVDAPHAASGSPAVIRGWLPVAGITYAENADLFARNSADLKTEFLRVSTHAAALQALRDLAVAEKWTRVAFHAAPLISDAIAALGVSAIETVAGYDVHALEKCDVGITACDALIAQTGSILLTSTSGGGRTLSVLPPHHVVLATHAQLLPDLSAGYELIAAKYGKAMPSFITLITGPSRTGDIERILVLGAHGPKKLTVVIIEE